MIAVDVWQSHFKKDPFSREAGEAFRKMIDKGGGASPSRLIHESLGRDANPQYFLEEIS